MFNAQSLFGAVVGGVGGEAGNSGGRSVQARETEAKILRLLNDESVQVISSFEMNQIATLTYHAGMSTSGDDLCEVVFATLTSVVSKPTQYPPLTLQKALVVARHVLIYGAQQVVNEARVMGRHVEALLEYNTVLMAQQQGSLLMRIKGGGVDYGGPVREQAKKLYALLTDINYLNFERNAKADPNSLVPIGDGKAVFVSDEVRLHMLKRKMQHQHMIEIRSNLAKAENGFGGGYNSRDGKAVVGAAHSLDEMIKMAQEKERRERMKFTDGPANHPSQPPSEPFSGYVAPSLYDTPSDPATTTAGTNGGGDLLSLDDYYGSSGSTAAPDQQHQGGGEVDLLGGFDSGTTAADSTTMPVGSGGGTTLPSTSYTPDLLGMGATTATSTNTDLTNPLGVSAIGTTAVDQRSDADNLLVMCGITPTASSSSSPIHTNTGRTSADAATGAISTSTPDVYATTDLLGGLHMDNNNASNTATSSLAGAHPSLPPQPQPQPPAVNFPEMQHQQQQQQQPKRPVMGGGLSSALSDPFAALSSTFGIGGGKKSNTEGPSVMVSSGISTSTADAAAAAPRNRQFNLGQPSTHESNNIGNNILGFANNTTANAANALRPSGVGGLRYPGDFGKTSHDGTATPTAAAPYPHPQSSAFGGVYNHAPATSYDGAATTSSLRVSDAHAPPGWGVSGLDGIGGFGGDDESGFVMGGRAGTGLAPTGPPPSEPPPPPPPPGPAASPLGPFY